MAIKRIGMVLDQQFPPDVRVENEAVSLVNNGFEVYIFSFTYGDFPQYENYRGIHIVRMPVSRKLIRKMRALVNVLPIYEIYLFKPLLEFIQKYKIEILHVHDLYLLGLALKVKKRLGIRIVSDLHENYVEGLKHYRFANTFPGNLVISIKKWAKKEKEWLEKVDKIIVVIEEAIERLGSLNIKKEFITVVPNYLNMNEFEKLGVQDEILRKYKDKFILSYIGAFDFHRGLHILIEGFSKFIKYYPEAILLMVGAGKNLDELKKQVADLKIQENVKFLGHQPHRDLPSYFTISNIGIIPHLKTTHTDNTIPHKLFNYMYKSKPLVVSDCAPLKRIVNETDCGMVYENLNPDSLNKGLLDLMAHSNKMEQMGKNGHDSVISFYNWQTSEKNLINLYKDL